MHYKEQTPTKANKGKQQIKSDEKAKIKSRTYSLAKIECRRYNLYMGILFGA